MSEKARMADAPRNDNAKIISCNYQNEVAIAQNKVASAQNEVAIAKTKL